MRGHRTARRTHPELALEGATDGCARGAAMSSPHSSWAGAAQAGTSLTGTSLTASAAASAPATAGLPVAAAAAGCIPAATAAETLSAAVRRDRGRLNISARLA